MVQIRRTVKSVTKLLRFLNNVLQRVAKLLKLSRKIVLIFISIRCLWKMILPVVAVSLDLRGTAECSA